MSTPDPILTQAAADRALALLREALSLLKGVEGPEQGLVAQTAERAERQGAAEDLRERGRVAPVTAEAALRSKAEVWHGKAMADRRYAQTLRTQMSRDGWEKRAVRCEARADVYLACAAEVITLLPKPASEADAPASTPSGETPTEANP